MKKELFLIYIYTSVLLFANKAYTEELPDFLNPVPLTIEEGLLNPPVPEGMVLVKGGCFQMGDTFGDGNKDERPAHEVCIDDFYIDKYEITQKAYKKVMGQNLSRFKGYNLPVENVTWYKAREYCEKIGKRLPTEAEWEYAAREGGKKTRFGTGTDIISSDISNFDARSIYKKPYSQAGKDRGKTIPVGSFKPNKLDLYDMSGNVWEWVADYYDKDYYKNSPKDNPKGPNYGTNRILRGGVWYSGPFYVRAVYRFMVNPDDSPDYYGFRCAR